MSTANLARELHKLREKRTTFRAFYLATRLDWQRMAAAVYKRWRLPPTVTADDVEQELLLHGWSAVQRWDATRGTSLESYVVWCAHSDTTKWIHKQRGCNLHTRKGASQYAWCIASMASDDAIGSRILENHADGTPIADETFDYAALLRDIPSVATSEAGRFALAHFIEEDGDLDRAAERFFADRDHRYLFRLGSVEKTKRLIQGEIRGVRRALLCEDGELT